MNRNRGSRRRSRGLVLLLAVAVVGVGLAMPAQAAPPVVKTVPWVATNPLISHDTWVGKTIRLKGTATVAIGDSFSWTWDFGDGSAVATGTGTGASKVNESNSATGVPTSIDIEASHAYSGTVGTVFSATLTVTDTTTNQAASQHYYVKLQTKTQPVEVNVAIDEGLWYLHKTQYRYTYSPSGQDLGYWNSGYAGSGWNAVWAANTNAFEVNGHLEGGDPGDPYTETVSRSLPQLFFQFTAGGIGPHGTPIGTINPDGNSNGRALYVTQGYYAYQGGSFVDAIVASGTPSKTVPGGPFAGSTYKDFVQDIVDGYANCQYPSGTVGSAQYGSNPVAPFAYAGGGWRYSCGDYPDNSPSQWAAISIIPSVREWGAHVDPNVVLWNQTWLKYSWDGHGFGYTDPGYYPWGPFAVTPSGMVQMVMDSIGRGNEMWDRTESWMRDNFDNGGGPGSSVKAYYYGLLSFVKSLLLSPCPTPAACGRDAGDTTPYGIKLLHSSSGSGKLDIDWYAAEAISGASSDGVARTLVNGQDGGGFWYGHNYSGDQYPFETAWAIMMLNQVVFTGGAPVAVATATPNPAMTGATVTLDGTGSFHQDPTKSIVQWDWDINNDGIFELHGPIVTYSWASLGTYPVTLRVTDNAASPATASSIINVIVSIPPLAPTANAGGPYNFCPAVTHWFLDGSKSVNPDEGQHQPGSFPGDTIYGNPSQFSWNLGTAFGDATGVKPDVTAFFTSKGVGSYLITLKVTDTTATSFPGSNLGNLSSTSTAEVFVRAASDPQCASCITNLVSYPKNRLVQLTYPLVAGVDHYNIYRATVSGGPYTKIGTALAIQSVYLDYTVTNGTTYYYVVRPATIGQVETCQSNQVTAKPMALAR